MQQYYVVLNNEQEGPYSIEELKSLRIQKDTPAWYDGLADWQPAGELEELKSLFNSTPPPFSKPRRDPQQASTPPRFAYAPKPKPIRTELNSGSRKRVPLQVWVGIAASVLAIIALIAYLQPKENFSSVAASIQPITQDSVTGLSQQSEQAREAAERKRRNDELTAKNMEIRNHWQKYFVASRSNYSIGSFGGISDLTVYVDNLSDYVVEEVVVTIYYYLANGNLHGINQVAAHNLVPGERQSLQVPDTGRGIKAEIAVTKIIGSRFHFLYSETYNSGNPKDPYYN